MEKTQMVKHNGMDVRTSTFTCLKLRTSLDMSSRHSTNVQTSGLHSKNIREKLTMTSKYLQLVNIFNFSWQKCVQKTEILG